MEDKLMVLPPCQKRTRSVQPFRYNTGVWRTDIQTQCRS